MHSDNESCVDYKPPLVQEVLVIWMDIEITLISETIGPHWGSLRSSDVTGSTVIQKAV